MLRKKSFYIVMIIAGICLIGISLLFKVEEVKAVAGSLIGIGAGLLGMSFAYLLMKIIEDKNPAMKRQNEIELKDERNTIIRNSAKAHAADITQWLIVGVAFVTILMYSPLWVTLIILVPYLSYHIISFYYMNKYQKEM